MPYIKPGVRTERTGLGGTPLGNTSFYIPTVIAQTLGKETSFSRTAASLSDGAYVSINGIAVQVGDTLTYEQLTYNGTTKIAGPVALLSIRQLFTVSETTSNPFARDYIEDTDFVLDKTDGTLDFTDAPALLAPEFDNFAQTAAGGLIAAGNYSFAIVARDANSNTTLGTEYASGGAGYFNVSVSSSSVTVRWGKVKNAGSYLIYAQPFGTFGAALWTLVATVSSGTTSSVEITAAIASGAVTLPLTNTTKHQPLSSGTIFVSYTHPVYNYDAPVRYFETNTVQQDHGIGSEAANAARSVMGPAGVGAANSSMYIVAPEISNGTIIGFQDAIAACETIQDLILMATTSSSDTVNDTLKAHCADMSSVDNQKERFCFVGTTSAVMADSDVQAVLDKILALSGSSRCVFVVTDGGHPAMDAWQNTIDKYNSISEETVTDAYTLNQAVDGQWHAIATMGMVAALGDPATPPTNKQVPGISSGEEGTVALWLDARKDTIAANGGCVLEDRFNNLIVRHGITLSQASTEDSEISIMLAESYMARTLRDNHLKFVGTKITDSLLQAIRYTASQVLTGLIGDEIIRSISGLTVYQDTTQPTWVYVVFSYNPIYPTNVIKFEWGFDLAG